MQAKRARDALLADIEEQVTNGTEPHLVRCYVTIPTFKDALFHRRQQLEDTFRDELGQDFMGMLRITKVKDRSSAWHGQLEVTIADNT